MRSRSSTRRTLKNGSASGAARPRGSGRKHDREAKNQLLVGLVKKAGERSQDEAASADFAGIEKAPTAMTTEAQQIRSEHPSHSELGGVDVMSATTNSGDFVDTNDGIFRCRMVPSSQQADQEKNQQVDLLRWLLSLKRPLEEQR
jgi:hypothetical protein